MIEKININMINQAIIKEIEMISGYGEVFRIEGPIIQKGSQTFIVDGSIAFDITPLKTVITDKHDRNYGGTMTWTPVIVGGKCFYSAPDEGRSGILTLYEVWNSPRFNRQPFKNLPPGQYKSFLWISFGWLYTNELELSNAEIEEVLIDEVLAGENVLTHKPAGWV